MPESENASILQLIGAGAFGAVVGWYVYYINRYRGGDVQLADLVTVIGAVGGGAVLALFPAKTALFGAYGIGLFGGFFGYFLVLLVLVRISSSFSIDWFLDGRRRKLADSEFIPADIASTVRPMERDRGGVISG